MQRNSGYHTPADQVFKMSDLYARSKKNALARGIDFSLTVEEFQLLVEEADGKCSVSGIPFSRQGEEFGKRKPFAPSLDRIHSHRGYTKENCRIVCILANLAMNEWGEKPLVDFCQAVYKTQLRKRVLRRASYRSNIPEANEIDATGYLKEHLSDVSPSGLAIVAKAICKRRGIEPQSRFVTTHQKADLSWDGTSKLFFPRVILDVAFPIAKQRKQLRMLGIKMPLDPIYPYSASPRVVL